MLRAALQCCHVGSTRQQKLSGTAASDITLTRKSYISIPPCIGIIQMATWSQLCKQQSSRPTSQLQQANYGANIFAVSPLPRYFAGQIVCPLEP